MKRRAPISSLGMAAENTSFGASAIGIDISGVDVSNADLT